MIYASNIRTEFRSDINGLRALAVVAVIFYHFGVPGFGGGFVGVDVFFVISGYLMTGIVVKGLERGSFSLFGFYMARARRIVPALVGLCAVLLSLGWFVLLPPDYKTLGSHAAYSLTFLSNIEFWLEAGYFDSASHEKWLLHTWSLSVEWQFYLLLPLALWVVWRLKPGRVAQVWAVSIGLAVSLSASILTTDDNPATAFFLLHTRAWEMLSGGAVFLLAQTEKLTLTKRKWLEAMGLLLILVSVAVLNKYSTWPGVLAVLPVSSAMMVLVANRSSPWTSNKIAQWLGDRSYSIYLWHWPIYVTLVYAELNDKYLATIGGLFATLLFGHLSYSLIENPSRKYLAKSKMSLAAGTLLLLTTVLLASAIWVWKHEGIRGRFSELIESVAAEERNTNPRREECNSADGRNPPTCIFGGQDWKAIAVGDSHVQATISALEKAKNNGTAGVVTWAYHACPFVFGMKKLSVTGRNKECPEFIDWVRERLNSIPQDIPVVIISRYGIAAFGHNEGEISLDIPDVYFSKVYPLTSPGFLKEFGENIANTACELAKQRMVFLMRPIPEMPMSVPKALSRRMAFGRDGDVFISMEQYRKRNAWVWSAQDVARDRCGIKILDPTKYLCDGDRCFGSKDGRPLYYDSHHLSEFGNKLLVPMFSEVFRME